MPPTCCALKSHPILYSIFLIILLDILVCLIKNIVILYLVFHPKNRAEFLFYGTLCSYTLECITELSYDIHDIIVNVVYNLFDNDWGLL